MKRPIAIATLFLALTTALPALAATPRAAAAPGATVQQGQMHRGAYNAYAAQPGTARFANHNTVRGRPCVTRSDAAADSAYPAWEMCN